MAGQDLTGFDKALKEVYGPRIEEQLNQLNVLQDYCDENDESSMWSGRVVKYPIHTGRNQGVGATAEASRLPAAGSQSYAGVEIPSRFNYARIELTIQVIKQSQSNKGAFTRAMDSELTGAVRDLANDRERQFFGAGVGTLALTQGAQNFNATTTYNVDSPYGVTPTTNGARFLNPNMQIAVVAAASSTIEGTFTVSSVAAAGTSVVLSATTNVTVSDNTRIVRAHDLTNAPTKNNLDNEVMGLLGLIDDGTFVNTLHNINRTNTPVFKAPVIPSVGQLSLDVIQRGIDATDELGGGNISQNGILFAHHSVRREYLKLLQADRRYTGPDLKKPDGGTRGAALKRGGEITYGDMPWRVAKHCPYGTLFGIQKGQLTRWILTRGEWADEDGSVLRIKAGGGFDVWEAFYRIFDNLGTDRPNDGFRLDGITATVNINHIF